MEKITIKQDLFNDEGVLLLSKGQEIILTNELKNKLTQLGLINKVMLQEEEKQIEDESNESMINSKKEVEINVETNIVYQNLINNLIDNVFKKKGYQENVALKKSSGIIENIIYNCKNKNWYSYFNTLIHYVDWLYAHSINTGLISCVIGIHMGYSNNQLDELALGAVFHDIGMTLLPTKVLNKSTSLTDMEMQIIRNHCEMGYSMLQETELAIVSKSIILQHHEKNDGTGYPNGLKETEILEASKIVSIAEAFDTATTSRPYKKAKPVEEVILEMMSRPNIYDTNIVRVLNNYIQ